jgi:hypothetical protein
LGRPDTIVGNLVNSRMFTSSLTRQNSSQTWEREREREREKEKTKIEKKELFDLICLTFSFRLCH